MPVTRSTFAGSWPDVGVLPDGRVVLTHLNRRADPPALTCVIDGGRAWQVPLIESGLYQRMAVSPSGRVLCAWQGVSGVLWVSVDGGLPVPYGRTYGQNCVGVYWDGETPRVVVQRTATRLDTLTADLSTPSVADSQIIPATSQGLRDVRPDGTIILGDAAMRTTIAGWLLSQPMTRGVWTVGQTDPPAIRVARTDRPYVTTLIPGDAYEPHLAVWGETVYACARTPVGVVLAVLTPPYPAHEPFGVVVPPPVPVPPPPAPVPPVVVRPTPMFPTDAELIDFTDRLETLYRDTLQRGPEPTHVDALGRGRWTYDYAQHRQAGLSHNKAWAKVAAAIDAAIGR